MKYVMSSFDELIMWRRSVRKFDADRRVSREQIEAIIGAAREAPSWNNLQTSRYYVVMDEAKKRELCTAFAPFDAKICEDASAVVVTTFEHGRSGFKQGAAVDELGDGWGLYDLGLHTAFFLLKAADLGVDSIVMGLRDAEKVRSILEIPPTETVVSFVGLGFRTKDVPRPKRKEVGEIAKFF